VSDARSVFHSLTTAMRLHVDRIPAAQEHYRLVTISDPRALEALMTCYRATPRKVECSMKNPFVSIMSVADVGRRLDEFTPANRAVFLDYLAGFTASKKPIDLMVPAYGLGPDGFLLLDGNHRVTAAVLSGKPVSVTLAVLDGPIDRRILWDLRFWDGGFRRFARRIAARQAA
jgi:hypothetical protein